MNHLIVNIDTPELVHRITVWETGDSIYISRVQRFGDSEPDAKTLGLSRADAARLVRVLQKSLAEELGPQHIAVQHINTSQKIEVQKH